MKKYNVLVSLLIGLPALVLVTVFAVHAVRNRPMLPASSAVEGSVLYEKQEVQQVDAGTEIEIGITSSGIAAFDQLVLERVKAIEDQFRKDVAMIEEMENWGQPPTLQIRSSYAEHEAFISVVLDMYSYTGGAHGMPAVETLTYNKSSGKIASLDDVLGGGTFVEILSNFVVSDLLGREDVFEETIIREAAGPQGRNFNAWSVSPEGVTIFFDPYEVAPFSAGIIDVMIPWSTIEMIRS